MAAALHERQRHQVASIQPEDVEHVICDARTAPIDLAIQDDLIHKQCADHVGDGRIMLRQLIAGEKPHTRAFPECEQADAVVLAFEDPLGSGKALLSQSRGHRDNPFRKSHAIPRLCSTAQLFSTTFCLSRNLGVCEYAAAPCTGPCSQHQLGGGLLIDRRTFQTGRNICASTTFLDRSTEQDRSCRLQGMSKMHPARLSAGFSSDCFARATATRISFIYKKKRGD